MYNVHSHFINIVIPDPVHTPSLPMFMNRYMIQHLLMSASDPILTTKEAIVNETHTILLL